VTASTVGYGDIAPNTEWARLFAIFYLPLITLSLAKVGCVFMQLYYCYAWFLYSKLQDPA
jgi:Ion channel